MMGLHQRRCAFGPIGSLLIGAAFVAHACGARAADEQRVVFRSGPERTGYVAGLRMRKKPDILWNFETKDGPHEPVVANGIVYFGDDTGAFHAVTAQHGELLWEYDDYQEQIFRAPAVAGDRVMFSTRRGVTALSRTEDEVAWHASFPCGASGSSPLPVGELVFVGGDDGRIHAFELTTGAEAWALNVMRDRPPDPPGFDGARARFQTHAARAATAASDGKTLFIPFFDQCRVIAVDCKTGEKRWSYQTRGWIFGNPVVAGEHVFIGSQDKRLYCLDKQTGKVAWTFAAKARFDVGGAVHGDDVFWGSADRHMYCIDRATGAERWRFKTEGVIYSAPIVSDDAIYFGSFDGYVYALDRKDGSLLWKLQPTGAASSIGTLGADRERLYVATTRNGPDGVFALGYRD